MLSLESDPGPQKGLGEGEALWPSQLSERSAPSGVPLHVYLPSSSFRSSSRLEVGRIIPIQSSLPIYLKRLTLSDSLNCKPSVLLAVSKKSHQRSQVWTSLVVHELRIQQPVQGTRVQSLVWEDPTCCWETELCITITEPTCPRAWAPPQEQALPREALGPQLGQLPLAATREKSTGSNEDPVQPEVNK